MFQGEVDMFPDLVSGSNAASAFSSSGNISPIRTRPNSQGKTLLLAYI